MSNLPKLKVKKQAWNDNSEIMEFEQAKTFPYEEEIVISVEGTQIGSYRDLLEFASRDDQKGKEYLEIMILPMILGG